MPILLLALPSTVALAASPAIPDRAVIVGRVGDAPWTDAPTEARVDQPAQLAVIVLARRGSDRVVLVPDEVGSLELSGHMISAHQLEPLAGAEVSWSAIEAHGFRTTPARNGAGSDFYSNVSTAPAAFGQWLGYDHIDYFERPIVGERPVISARVLDTAADVEGADPAYLPDLGTLRVRATVTLPDGRRLSTPGIHATDMYGILPAVHRVSIRAGDDFLGWLTSYALVPEVFGSAGPGANHQTERYTGADCADVLVGAIRRAGRTDIAYTNVAGLPAYTMQVAGTTELDEHGAPPPGRAIAGIERGDLIRIDYAGALRHRTPRRWDHVVVLWEDRSDPAGPAHGGPDGKLDGFDLVIHMGHPRLVIERLSAQAPATVDVLRWRPRR
jgi:hypothetical protein